MSSVVDVVLVVCVLAGAGAFLAWRLLGPRAPPACHKTTNASTTSTNVIMGASLQRGLARAQRRSVKHEDDRHADR